MSDGCRRRASWYSSGVATPSYQEALSSHIPQAKITRPAVPAVATAARQLIGVSCQSSESAPLSVFWSVLAPGSVEAAETSNGSPLRTLTSLT